jgi:hypothetical protein
MLEDIKLKLEGIFDHKTEMYSLKYSIPQKAVTHLKYGIRKY